VFIWRDKVKSGKSDRPVMITVLETHALLKKFIFAIQKKKKIQWNTVRDFTDLDSGLPSVEFSGVTLGKSRNCPVLHFHIFKKKPTALPIPEKLCKEKCMKDYEVLIYNVKIYPRKSDINLLICLIQMSTSNCSLLAFSVVTGNK